MLYRSRGPLPQVLKSELSKDLEKMKGLFQCFGEYVKLKGFDDRSIDYVQKAIGGMVFDAEMEKYAKTIDSGLFM
ncbi:hypothetical protein CEXT_411061 [Caerostris extrusa]|uniref:Uncharacterized protein n=1 Tax=Caerostris extrusa TaxID=172846 RepID=A0AAV4SRA6_CAEEX|nr:hypothetical protein CEXT_411061 [Caerostris extrusa]